MSNKSVLITGHNGDIGKAIVSKFKCEGFYTIGIDRIKSDIADYNIELDLERIVLNKSEFFDLVREIEDVVKDRELFALVNNAATQVLGGIDSVSIEDFTKSLNVNLKVPFLLSKAFYPSLSRAGGSIVNIGSIHSEVTKSEFISYATSKSGLKGLTKSMAVDFGHKVRVNMVQPAAIETQMLRAGFEDDSKLDELERYHPTRKIGQPVEVAESVYFLVGSQQKFLNGCLLNIDGGISSCLHDPSNGQ